MIRSDVQLMLDVKAGDEASFDFLLQKYRMPLVNFLYRMVRDRPPRRTWRRKYFCEFTGRENSILRARSSRRGSSGSRRIWR